MFSNDERLVYAMSQKQTGAVGSVGLHAFDHTLASGKVVWFAQVPVSAHAEYSRARRWRPHHVSRVKLMGLSRIE